MIRKERYPYIPHQGVNQEGVSKSHLCFEFYQMKNGSIPVRSELSYFGCDHYSSATFLSDSGHLQCNNSDICGSWEPYPI